MVQLVLEFLLPSLLITIVFVLTGSVIRYLAYIAKHEKTIEKQQFRYNLVISGLLIIPVLSFATLAIFVVVKSILS